MADFGVACRCCGGELDRRVALRGHDRLMGTAGEFTVRVCTICGTGITFPLVDEQALGAFYDSEYNPHVEWQPAGILAKVSQFVQRFIRWRARRSLPVSALAGRSGTALDVGCGRGDLGALLIDQGWDVTGVEPSEAACAIARKQGVDALAGTLDQVDLDARRFDAITFQHSLEHVIDPRAELKRVVDLLQPGGMLLVSVPNFGARQRRIFRGRWFHLDLPRHRFHYTADGLRALAEDLGLDVLQISTSSSPVGLPCSLSYALFGRLLFTGALTIRLMTAAALIIYPVSLALDAAGGGDILHFIARETDADEHST